MQNVDPKLLTGQTESHLARLPDQSVLLHREVIAPLQSLQQRAAREGFDLQVASGFRSFARQLDIWNAKAEGRRPVLDECGQPLDISTMEPLQKVHAIMRWSALPGASRHHWGTDFDVWDRAAVSPDYPLQLTPQEYDAGGPFERLNQWLQQQAIEAGPGFYRPYAVDRGGIAPEPWHLSYRPLADQYARELTPALLSETVSQAPLALKSTVLAHLDELFGRYIAVN